MGGFRGDGWGEEKQRAGKKKEDQGPHPIDMFFHDGPPFVTIGSFLLEKCVLRGEGLKYRHRHIDRSHAHGTIILEYPAGDKYICHKAAID